MKRNIFLLLTTLFLIGSSVVAQDNEEKYALKAKPVPTQCEALTEDENAAVAKASKDLSSADAAGKIRILGELKKSCHRKAVEAIGTVLQDKDAMVRQAAVEALGHLGDQESIETLAEMTTDPDWRVRISVGYALCSFQKSNPSAIALNRISLVNAEKPDTEGDVRARLHTIILINQLRDASFSRKSYNYLFSLMDTDNQAFRKLLDETMLALKETKNAQYELIGLLKQHMNPNMRRKAAYWLGQLKIERGRWQLKEASEEDGDESVRKAAAEALKLLGPTDEEPPAAAPKTKAAASKTKATKAPPKGAPKFTTKK